ncbi:MAG: hypothetical protein H7210_07730 [Pyrinomonadaceae bacterium]|nr:hypothetical protein [Phycisphaerales bacterium]
MKRIVSRQGLSIQRLGSICSAATAMLVGSAIAGPPANDECPGDLPALVLNTPAAGTTVEATFTVPATCMTDDVDVWYLYTTKQPGPLRLSAAGSDNSNLSLAVLTGCTFPYGITACGVGTTKQGPAVDVNPFSVGETLFIRIGSTVGQNFTVLVEPAPPPANDECVDAIPLVLDVPASASSLAATTSLELADSSLCSSLVQGFTTGADVFYSFRPEVSGFYDFDTCGTEFDSALSVHTGCPATVANLIACNDNAPLNGCNVAFENNTSYLFGVPLTAQTTYYVRVAGVTQFEYTGRGAYNVRVRSGVETLPPANDLCENATTLIADTFTSGTTALATGTQATCGFQDVWDVWYEFTSPAAVPTLFAFTITAGAFDGQATMSAYDGCGGDVIACQDFSPFTVPIMTLTVNLQPGQSIRLRVAGQGGTQDSFELYTEAGPPSAPNSSCSGAIAISEGVPVTADTSNSAASAATPCSGFPDIYGLWYAFTSTQAGYHRFATDLVPSSERTTLAIYAACNQEPLVCTLRGDAFSTEDAAAAYSILMTQGQTVLIRVALDGSGRGQFSLTATGPLAPPPAVPNDQCESAQTVSSMPLEAVVDITQATNDLQICTLQSQPLETALAGIWYRFAPASDVYLVGSAEVSDEGRNGRVTVFTGACGSLTQVFCPDNFTENGAPVLLSAGITYHILASVSPSREGGSFPVSYGTTLSVHLQTITPPANDDCATAQRVTDSSSVLEFTTLVADADAPQPSCIGAGGVLNNAVWFTFTTASAGSLTVHGEGTNFEQYLYSPGGVLYSGSCGALSQVACDSPLNGFFITREFDFSLDLPAGQTYYLAVGAYSGPAGGDTSVTITYTGTFSEGCLADFNTDGFVDSQDFFDFLSAFFTQTPSADINHDTFINSQDFFDFLGAFFTGCP